MDRVATEIRNMQLMVEQALADSADFVDRTLDALLPKAASAEEGLLITMRSLALNKSDRFRGFLVLQAGGLFSVDRGALGRTAAAVEAIHACFPLHPGPDHHTPDMSAARDSLIAFAYHLLSAPETHGDPFMRCDLVLRLSHAMGHSGLAGGGIAERALAEQMHQGITPAMHDITRLERMKTTALIAFCGEAGAVLGKGSPAARMALSNYGQELGLAFQITEDLNSDDTGQRPSVVTMLGRERAQAQARALAQQAAHHLDLFDEKADLLRAAAEYVVARV